MRSHARASSAIAAAVCGIVLCLGAGIAQAVDHLEFPDLSQSSLNTPCGAATDAEGNLYLSIGGEGKVAIYDTEGDPITSFSTAAAVPCGLAVDASGNVYVTGRDADVTRYKPSSFPPTAGTTYAADTTIGGGTGVLVKEAAAAVAVDPETQRAYVARQALSEQQTLTFTGFVAANKFTLTCDGETTGEIEYSTSNTTRSTRIKTALETKCGAGNFNVTSATGGLSTISWIGKYLGDDVALTTCTPITGTGTCPATQSREAKASAISVFKQDGTLVSADLGKGLIAHADFYGIDVYGQTGEIYVIDRAHNKALILNSSGSAIEEEIDGSEAPTGAFTLMALQRPQLAVDQDNGNVFVSDIAGHGAIDEFEEDEAGNYVYVSQLTHTPPFTEAGGTAGAPSDIAVDNGTTSENRGTIYVTSSEDGNVYAFGPDPHDPPLNQLTIEKIGAGSGTVTSAPAGVDCGPTCVGEFANGKVVTLSAKASAPGSVFGAWISGCDSVSEGKCVVEMSEARTVKVRFDSRPVVSEQTASEIAASSVQLTAKVNPKEKATAYRFEYISEADWLANGESFEGANPATKTSSIAIGAGTSPVAVGIKAEALEPSTAYRFRVVATNDIGTAEGGRDPKTDTEVEHSFATYAAPQVFAGECPGNEALRTGPSASLPDCRAYEQASPVGKNGGSIQSTTRSAKTSENGDTISFESTTGVPAPDGSGAQNFPTYVAKRSDSGGGSWETTGLLPDPSSGQRARVLGWTPDFATAFDQAELLGVGSSLLARSTGDGAQAEIVPHTSGPFGPPSYNLLGTSADGSEAAFETTPQVGDTTLQLTPDAAPGQPNVYAWDRDEPGELHLAGVLPDGTTPVEGSQAGRGPDGKEYNQDTRLVGAEGSVFFNDAGDGQLYLRLNPTAEETEAVDGKGNCIPDPVLACTVHISASQKENGKGLPNGDGKRDAAGPQPASFMAANPDGSVITFTSSEKLTNDANTGPEPEAEAIARAKASDGGDEDLDLILTSAREIAIDQVEGYVYWSDPANGRIGRAKLDGTEEPEPDYVTGLGEPIGIAVINEPTAKYIFWTDRGELDAKGKAQAGKGTIGRVDLDGANLTEGCLTGLTNPRSIAADPSFIYWTMPSDVEFQGKGKMGRASLDCVPAPLPTPIDELASGDVAVNATHIYYSLRTVPVGGQGRSFIRRANLDGTGDTGAELVLVEDVKSPVGIALDGAHLYWAASDTHTIGRSDLDGTNASEEPSFIDEAGRPEDPAIGGEHIYWTANQKVVPNSGSDIYQLVLDDQGGAELTDLAPDTVRENGIEVQGVLGTSEDGSYVYFAANGVPDGVGNSPNEEEEEAKPGNCKGTEREGASGTCNLYLYHDGEVSFIARLQATPPSPEKDSGDSVNWIRGNVDVLKALSGKSARASADGQTLVFRSSRQLTEYENEGPRCGALESGERISGACLEFYRFDYEEMSLACLTCDPRGATPEGPARLGSLTPNVEAPEPSAALSRNLSRDGNRFFFETPDALVAADTNGGGGCPAWGAKGLQRESILACQDVYEWEAPGTGSCTESSPAYSSQNQGCIYLVSTGKSKEASFFADADLEGENVFIFTYDQLVPQDRDGLLDAYDARVGGGLASQHQVESPPCEGETCKDEPTPPVTSQSPGSSSFAGPTNVKDRKPKARRCAKGKRKVRAKGKVRCVSKRSKRAANKSRRAGR